MFYFTKYSRRHIIKHGPEPSKETKSQALNEAAKWEILLRRDNCVNKGKTKNQRHGTGPCPYTTGHHLVWRCPIRCRGRQNKLEGRHVPEPLKGSIQTSLQVPGKPRGEGEGGGGGRGEGGEAGAVGGVPP